MRPLVYVVFVAMVISIAYVFITYLRMAGLHYTPPWGDLFFYLSALAGVAAVGMGASGLVRMHGGWRATLIIGGLLVVVECGGAAWFDHSFRAQCNSLPPNTFAPGCPDPS